MNRYGQTVYDHNRRFRPEVFAEIPDPELFFEETGEEIAAAVAALRDQILGGRRQDETPEDYRFRSYSALRTAEEVVLADHHLMTAPEEEEEGPGTAGVLEAISQAMSEADEILRTPET